MELFPKLICIAMLVSFLLTPAVCSAAEQPRTPAEIELRRAAIAQRFLVLQEEQVSLEARLRGIEQQLVAGEAPASKEAIDEEQAKMEVRLNAVLAERESLSLESEALAAIATRTATGPINQADPPGLAPLQAGTGQVTAGNAFNPAITVIADGLYYADDAADAGETAFAASGFGKPGLDAVIENPTRGFSLREAELTFSGTVDPYFDLWATFGVAEGEIETEEVYVQTRQFLPGVQVRFGQFFSGIGYINKQHRHQWDFIDQALPYEALFDSNLKEVGVQVTWLPALPVYTQFGFEALQGDNALVSNQLFEQKHGPRLFTGFLKVSPDLGFSNTLQAGASFGRSRSHQEVEANEDGAPPEAFEGATWFLGTDWIWRYDSNRQFGKGDVTVQGEYIYRSKELDRIGAMTESPSLISGQDGFYAQAVYGIGPRWTIGGRLEAIGLLNRVETMTQSIDIPASKRYSVDVTFNPTEYSRLRVQYNRGSFSNGGWGAFNQVYVQFQMSLGVHGAHLF